MGFSFYNFSMLALSGVGVNSRWGLTVQKSVQKK